MLYLLNKTNAQTILVPRDGNVAAGQLSFTLTSTVDLDTPLVAQVSSTGNSSLYFAISVSLPAGIPDGEYEYSLAVTIGVLSRGLLCVGILPNVSRTDYEKTIEYEQYK